MLPLIRREEMDYDITIVDYHPAFAGFPLSYASLAMHFSNSFQGGFSQGVKHPVAGSCAQDKVIRERSDRLQIKQEDIFGLFGFQRADNCVREFECVQHSPQCIWIRPLTAGSPGAEDLMARCRWSATSVGRRFDSIAMGCQCSGNSAGRCLRPSSCRSGTGGRLCLSKRCAQHFGVHRSGPLEIALEEMNGIDML